MSSERIIAGWNRDAAQKDEKLIRSWIDAIKSDGYRAESFFSSLGRVRLRRVCGMSTPEGENGAKILHKRISEALSGMSLNHDRITEFVFAICGNGATTSFYIGAENDIGPLVTSSMEGALEDAVWAPETVDIASIYSASGIRSGAGGLITGMPVVPVKDEEYRNPVHTLVSGMLGSRYVVLYLCRQTVAVKVRTQLGLIGEMQSEMDRMQNIQFSATETNARAESFAIFNVKRYLERLQEVEKHLRDSEMGGAWTVCGQYYAERSDALRLGSLLRTALGGSRSGPEPVRATLINGIDSVTPDHTFRPAYPDASRDVLMSTQSMVTQLSSRQLAGMLMLPDREVPGFFVNDRVNFDMTPRRIWDPRTVMEIGDVLYSVYKERPVDKYLFPRPDLDRHALVVGATGGGKSNTIRSLLKRLWAAKIPFMVIESAKSEYWQLAKIPGFEELCALQLGDIDSPFRINPFECAEGFSLQTHVDSLLATFNAAFEMYPPMPYILEQAVYRVYKSYGWNVATGKNSHKNHRYPTLSDLYLEIPRVVERTAYDREIKNNVQGALQTRVRSLMIGGKGKMMDVRRSTPMDWLLKKPLVLELESLGDDSVKAFCIGLLMNRLYEYRRAHSDGTSMEFSHLLILEEAHRLLKNIPESTSGGNPQAASVAFFCNMLSEIRSYGQGILIADQSPTKLAPDAIRNTNLKIVHRIVDANDRKAVGGAMHMDEAQVEALTALGRGCAAVYSEGDHRPRIVKMELVKYGRAVSRTAILSRSAEAIRNAYGSKMAGSNAACGCCPNFNGTRCAVPMTAGSCRNIASRLSDADRRTAIDAIEENGPNSELMHQIVLAAMRNAGCADRVPESGFSPETAAMLKCVAGHILKDLGCLEDDLQDVAVVRYGRRLGINDI